MIRVERVEGRESVLHENRDFTLVSRTWTIAVTAPRVALGWRYHQPSRVESRDGSVPIRDYLMIGRMSAMVIVLLIAIVRRQANG